MNRRFIRNAVYCAIIYLLVSATLHFAIFMLSHVPPKAVNLDKLILWLVRATDMLTIPRRMLRHLWPWETTPTILVWTLPVLNCAVWGVLLAGLKSLWDELKK